MIVNQYEHDRRRSDRCIPALCQILGQIIVRPAPKTADQCEATDLIVLTTAAGLRIAARIRDHSYAERFPFQFTIRARRESGVETELSKMRNGFGDWFIYGFEGVQPGTICRWCIIDLAAWRWHIVYDGFNIRGGRIKNWDDETYFVWFDLRSFLPHPALLIASSFPVSSRQT